MPYCKMVNREINSVDNQINSYLNEDIIRLIFKKIPINDLKNARLVCRLWNQIIHSQLQHLWDKLKPIELHTEKEISRLLRAFRNTRLYNKQKSFQCSFEMKICILKLPLLEFFTYFSIKYLKLNLGSEILEETELDLDFFGSNILPQIAPNLEEFQIIINNESKVKFVIPCVFESLHLSCPNLKKINFSTVSRESNSRLFLAILFQEMSSNSTNLTSVKLLYKANKYLKSSAFTTESLNLMRETQLSEIIPQIQHLSLYEYDKSVLEDLLRVSSSLKLRCLRSLEVHLNLFGEPGMTLMEEVQNLYELLLKVSKNLEELSLQTLAVNCDSGKKPKLERTILIPKLDRCTRLKFQNYDLNNDEHKIANEVSNYFRVDLDSFPNLYEVELTYFGNFDTMINSISWSNCPNVRILGVNFIQVSDGQTGKLLKNSKTPNFNELVKFFPNVETLKVKCSDSYKGFKNTFIPWIKMKELIVHCTPSDFEAYNFYRIIHLKDLTRIELYNSRKETKNPYRNKLIMPQFETMKKLNLRHLKIVNFKILLNILKIFDKRYNFEYRCIDDIWIGAYHPEEINRKIVQTGGYYIT